MSDALLFKDIDEPGLNTLGVYEARGGYSALRKALALTPAEVLEQPLPLLRAAGRSMDEDQRRSGSRAVEMYAVRSGQISGGVEEGRELGFPPSAGREARWGAACSTAMPLSSGRVRPWR